MLTGVALAGSNGGKVGSGPVSVTVMLGIFNGARAGCELANVALEFEGWIEPGVEGTLDCIACARTVATKAVINKIVSKPITIIFLIFLHLCFRIVTLTSKQDY